VPHRARAIFGTIWARRLSCCWRACESGRRRGDVSTYALMPIGYPRGNLGSLSRRPVGEVAYADSWVPFGGMAERQTDPPPRGQMRLIAGLSNDRTRS
jgi:hypothetical protein